MNFSGQYLILLTVVTAIFIIWVFLKPRKTEKRRFSIKERRLKKQEEKVQKDSYGEDLD
jgi:hypothetical protein